MTIDPARTYTVGSQPTSYGTRDTEPGYEEVVGTNWFQAAQELDTIMRTWAHLNDSYHGTRDKITTERVDTALREAPPVFPADARYEVRTPESLVRVFYLIGSLA